MIELINKSFDNRSELVFTFKIDKVNEFLKKSDGIKYSDVIKVRGIPFFYTLHNRIKNGSPIYLDFFVHCDYEPKVQFACKVLAEVKLISNDASIRE